MTSFTVAQKKVDVFCGVEPGSPVIYLDLFSGEVNGVLQSLQDLGCPDLNLVVINGLDWDHDMAPWYMRSFSKGDRHYACHQQR